jgi:hypothetical protein
MADAFDRISDCREMGKAWNRGTWNLAFTRNIFHASNNTGGVGYLISADAHNNLLVPNLEMKN